MTRSLLLVALLLLHAVCGAADSYPQRPIRLIVGVPPGGAADFTARIVGAKMTEALGQTVVVDIDNGMTRNKLTATVEILLDASGNGSATWTVPAWTMAKFNAPGVAEVALAVSS